MCDLLAGWLKEDGFEVVTHPSGEAALADIGRLSFDVVLTDLGMAGMNGLALTERILGTTPDVPVIVITGQTTVDAAISAMRAGAYDFLTKPVDGKLFKVAMARAIQHRDLIREVKRLREDAIPRPNALIGDSEPMKQVLSLVARVSQSRASVLIHGQTGTGKELIARAIHAASGCKGPFVAINCAAVPPHLLESELFGHAKGAFTDARGDRKGLFVQADGGTLFLDEISEMPIDMQAKLLRALQERTVRPVGSNSEVAFDARVIAATHRNIEDLVAENRFREDLYYRLNVVTIDLPPLRERRMDVLKLASHFLQKHAPSGSSPLSLSAAVAERLLSYDWPGNVRELENCMERAVALAEYHAITIQDLPQKIRAYRAGQFVVSADDPAEIITLEELERRYIERVLKLLGGNKSRVAQVLGLDRRTLYRKLERYAVDEAALSTTDR